MNAELESIRVAWEVSGMTPEQIAEDRELELTAVKAALMQCSSKYRKACGATSVDDDTLNFTNQDLMDVNDVIKRIALYSPDENLALKAAMYIRDDKKGRKEVVKAIGGNTFNILQFNEQMRSIRETKRQFLTVEAA